MSLPNANRGLLIAGIVFIILSFVAILSLFVFDYYRKKAMNKVKEWFSIDTIINHSLLEQKIIDSPFKETEMYPRDYLSFYHHDLSNDRETKWISKTYLSTYKDNDIFIRASYIINFKDAKTFLINGKKLTQWYIQIPIMINDKIIISTTPLTEMKLICTNLENNFIYSKKELSKSQVDTITNLIKKLNSLNINYEVLLDNNNAFIFFLVEGNDLYINFENKKFDLVEFTKQINNFDNILKELIN